MNSEDFPSWSSDASIKFTSYGEGQPYSDVLGKRRTFGGLSRLEWIFLTVSTVNLVATIGITIERMIEYGKDMSTPSPDFTFALLLFINALFCTFYVYNGVLREQTFEIVAFMASIIIVLGYCVVEYILNVKGRNLVKLIRLVISCVLAPFNLYLAGRVATQFGWLEFRIAGATELLQNMYRQRKAFFSLQRFDFQAAISFVVLGLEGQTQVLDIESYIVIVGFVVLIVWMIMGFIAVKREIRWLVYCFAFLSILDPIYAVLKLTTICMQEFSHHNIESIIFYPILSVGATTLLVRAILMAELYFVVKNFDKGLGDQAFQELVASETTGLLSGRVRRRQLCCCNLY